MNALIFIPHDSLLGPQGAMQRLRGLIRALRNDNIAYLIPSSVPENEKSAFDPAKIYFFDEPQLGKRRVPYLLDLSAPWLDALKSACAGSQVDLVIFNFPWGLSAARKKVAKPLVYFSHGVESDFAEITLRHMGLSFQPLKYLFRRFISVLEGQAAKSADLIVTMSQRDGARLAELYSLPIEKIFAYPQPIEIKAVQKNPALRSSLGFAGKRKIILFHGSWAHLPNREAIEALRKTVAPAITAQFPDAGFIVAGPGVPTFNEPGIVGLGFVENLPALLGGCDLACLPILSGCGVRMKLFDYFQAGLACVGTRKAVEGLDLTDGKEMLISENNLEDFTKRLLQLLTDDALCAALGERAVEYLALKHDPDAVSGALAERLQNLAGSFVAAK